MDKDAQEQKQSLMKQKSEGDALREWQSHQGWGEFVTILEDIYKDNVAALITADFAESRAMLKALEKISDVVSAKIDFGKVAAEELQSERFKLTQATP